MKDLFIVAWGAGLQDGLNPCIFMACALIIFYGQGFVLNFLPVNMFCFIFCLLYVVSCLFLDLGPGQALVLQKNFIFIANVLCVVLSVGVFVLGILYFRDWFLLSRGCPAKDLVVKKNGFFVSCGKIVCLMVIVLAVIAVATLGPINKYIIFLSNAALIKGQWHTVLSVLVSYILISMWPLWLVWSFLSIKNVRPSMVRIVCAAIFFTASSCMILIVK